MHFVMWQHETLEIEQTYLKYYICHLFIWQAALVGQLAGYILS
jgi:hypothetical protein